MWIVKCAAVSILTKAVAPGYLFWAVIFCCSNYSSHYHFLFENRLGEVQHCYVRTHQPHNSGQAKTFSTSFPILARYAKRDDDKTKVDVRIVSISKNIILWRLYEPLIFWKKYNQYTKQRIDRERNLIKFGCKSHSLSENMEWIWIPLAQALYFSRFL